MPTQVRQRKSGALVFHPTKDDVQIVRDRRRLKEIEKEVKEMKEFINRIKEQSK